MNVDKSRKSNFCTQETGGEIAMIEKTMNRIKFEIGAKLIRGHYKIGTQRQTH